MKSFSKSLLMAAAAALALALTAPGAQAVCSGDVNGGGLSVADVSIILTCANNPAAAICASSCGGAGIVDCGDVNLDGVVNIADAVIVLNETSPGCKRNVVPLCTSAGSTLPCGATINSDITANTVLGACEYKLDGTVFVQPGVVVTMRPGAVVKGIRNASDGTPSALIFLQGDCSDGIPFTARINAVGTPASPIVLTSDQPVGSRLAGDWGGIAFNGCAAVNSGGTGSAEGLIGVTFGGGLTPILNDSSGIARYVRAEFAGRELAPNNELNVWTQNGLGSCTQWDHIQAHMGKDDGFEWFGGSNNSKYLVATANADDNLDTQLGTTGDVQFALIGQANENIDTAGSNGFEADNDESTFLTTPVNEPKYCNVTVLGTKAQTTPANPGGSFIGVFQRRGTAGRIAKTIVAQMQEAGLQLRDSVTGSLACDGDCLVGGNPRTNGTSACDGAPGNFSLSTLVGPHHRITKSIFFNNGAGGTVQALTRSGGNNTGKECNSAEYYGLLVTAGEISNADPGLATSTTFPYPALVDPRPTIPANVADATDCGALFGDPFFESTTYIGAFQPGGTNWLDTPGGWISYATN